MYFPHDIANLATLKVMKCFPEPDENRLFLINLVLGIVGNSILAVIYGAVFVPAFIFFNILMGIIIHKCLVQRIWNSVWGSVDWIGNHNYTMFGAGLVFHVFIFLLCSFWPTYLVWWCNNDITVTSLSRTSDSHVLRDNDLMRYFFLGGLWLILEIVIFVSQMAVMAAFAGIKKASELGTAAAINHIQKQRR